MRVPVDGGNAMPDERVGIPAVCVTPFPARKKHAGPRVIFSCLMFLCFVFDVSRTGSPRLIAHIKRLVKENQSYFPIIGKCEKMPAVMCLQARRSWAYAHLRRVPTTSVSINRRSNSVSHAAPPDTLPRSGLPLVSDRVTEVGRPLWRVAPLLEPVKGNKRGRRVVPAAPNGANFRAFCY